MKTRRLLWLRTLSTLLDVSAIYCISGLMQVLLYQFTFICFGNIFTGVFICYYFLFYLFMNGRTPGKVFTNLRIVGKNGEKATALPLAAREVVFKGIIGIWLMLNFFENVPLRTNTVKTASEMLLILIISAIYLLVFRQTWWEWLSGTSTVKEKVVSKALAGSSFGIFAAAYIAFIFVSVYPLIKDKNNLFTKYGNPYPQTKEVRQYAAFIRDHSQDPVEYMFELFKKYDLVVISERMHPEYSQYEFIFKLLKDPRFSEKVGNIFTECGSASYQDSLAVYLHCVYQTEDELNRATARLQRNSSAVWPLWSNTNLFDMFKTVHNLNVNLPDSSKINWYFTDLPVNWETATHETYIKNYTTPARDSLMAAQVIEKYRDVLSMQKRSKALVIMNTYHGFGLAPNGKNYFGGTTGYIMKALPGKVANIMMNGISMKYLTAIVPVDHGKWDAAFELAGNAACGFDFAGSPFGDDRFEGRFMQIKGLGYKDVFTGLIFYTPLSKQWCKNGFPYEFDIAEDVMIRRAACVSPEHADMIRRLIEDQKRDPGNIYDIGTTRLPIIYNLIHMIGVPFLMFIFLLSVITAFLVKIIRINKSARINQG